MDRTVALVVAVAIGGVLATQAPLNSALARTVGGVQASVVALGISFAALLALALLAGGLSGIGRLGEAPLHVAVGGGLIGALYVGSIVWTVRALGAGGLTAATIAGQLALAVVIDHFGWLGVARSPITAAKVFGIALLALGTWFVVRISVPGMTQTRREIIQAFVPNSPLVGHLGIELTEIEPDRAVLTMPFRPELATMGDVVHGGAIASLLDTASMAAAWSDDTVPDALAGGTVSMNVDYVSAARGIDLVATAVAVRRGRSLCFCEVTVAGPDGAVVAKGLAVHRFG